MARFGSADTDNSGAQTGAVAVLLRLRAPRRRSVSTTTTTYDDARAEPRLGASALRWNRQQKHGGEQAQAAEHANAFLVPVLCAEATGSHSHESVHDP